MSLWSDADKMKCPECGDDGLMVRDSRPAVLHTLGVHGIRRRRACAECGYRFSTFELPVPQLTEFMVEARLKHLKVLRDTLDDMIEAETKEVAHLIARSLARKPRGT